MKGARHQEEYTWFTLMDTLPVTSISARRAAKQIVNATRLGKAELVISIQAQMLAFFHSLFPGLTADIMGIVNRFLPSGEEAGIAAHSGRECETAITQSFLTVLGQRASQMYNEDGH